MPNWQTAIALRYTRSSQGDRLVSFISLASTSGLVLGVAVLVIVLSVMNGFEQELRTRVLGVLPHGVLTQRGGIEDWPTLAASLEQHEDVIAVAPFLQGGGLVVGAGQIQGVTYFGVEPAAEVSVSILHEYFVDGSLMDLQKGKFKLAMGSVLANKMAVAVGDKITLVLPEARLTLAGPIPRTKRFTISSIFSVGSDADKNNLYIHIDDALRLTGKTQIDSLRLKSTDLFEIRDLLRDLLGKMQGEGFYANSWMSRQGNLYDAILMQKTTMFLLLLMLIMVAAFNIVANLVMIVNEKKPDIAILRTMGATTREVLTIFISYGLLIGLVGVSVGIVLGVLTANYITEVYTFIDSLLQLGLMDEYFIHYLPSQILLSDLILIGAVAMFICFVVTIYPAILAARANPVEALKNE